MRNVKLIPKCNKIVHSAPLTCVLVIPCVSGSFWGDLARDLRRSAKIRSGSDSKDHKSHET